MITPDTNPPNNPLNIIKEPHNPTDCWKKIKQSLCVKTLHQDEEALIHVVRNLRIKDTGPCSHFVLCREVVLSLEGVNVHVLVGK